ncbi:MAG: glycosyltransferase [Pseudomonadota bacterium]
MRILTLTTVFPNFRQPLLGLFIKERMRHVAARKMVRVVAPVPVSPLDPVARWLKPGFRPATPEYGISEPSFIVDHPPFLCFPGLFKALDGVFYFFSLYYFLKTMKRYYNFDMVDAHFAYPDGVAAALLSKVFNIPFTITLRGTEAAYTKIPSRKKQMQWALHKAARVICVSESLGKVAQQLSTDKQKIRVIPNGVDTNRFSPIEKSAARRFLRLDDDAKVLLTVGGLVERKGFHRVIDILPKIKASFGNVVYLIVGGSSVEGDFSRKLGDMVNKKGLSNVVRFEGAIQPKDLAVYYSAADLFVLPTSNEGWANVFLESLACGTPVITTDVGGNREVIVNSDLGTIVPFGDAMRLETAVTNGLKKEWNPQRLIGYARQRTWDKVAEEVVSVFEEVVK